MNAPRVSVVVPAYRAAATIRRALDSVLSQTRPPDEILVIDDGSPDDVAAAIAPYGARVRLHRQANGGASSARNRGIDLATGDFLAFLDADDYWEPTKLERQLAIMERHPQVGVVAGQFYQQIPGQPRHHDALPPCYLDRVLRTQGAEALTVARLIWTSMVFIRRAVLNQRRFDTSLKTAEDVDLWMRLVLAAPVYLVAEPLATAVLEAGSLSRSDAAADAKNMLSVLHRYAPLLGREGLRRGKVRVYREWAATHLSEGEPRAALVPAWKRWTHQPWSPQAWWILLKSAIGCRQSAIGFRLSAFGYRLSAKDKSR